MVEQETSRTMASGTTASRQDEFVITAAGDVMLGRLVDQILPFHVRHEEDEMHARYFKARWPELRDNVGFEYPWGELINYFRESDLNIINLETAVTTHPTPYPNKTFNYRMHPGNINTLLAARIDYCSLANNHTLDFGVRGLVETVETLERSGIGFAGCGETKEQARNPYILTRGGIRFAFLSASDHPSEWSRFPEFHFVNTHDPDLDVLEKLIDVARRSADVVVFSFHWGPNYAWGNGIEIYKSRPILYGCGDFVDDYAVDPEYRNNLGFLHRLHYRRDQQPSTSSQKGSTSGPGRAPTSASRAVSPQDEKMHLDYIELIPTRIEKFRVRKAKVSPAPGARGISGAGEDEAGWLASTMTELCQGLGTKDVKTLEDGRLIINVSS
ncbi:hypothetical protein HK102_005584 [Quaeritorhiza haematococci]|nr:hypothetical protein HK102_005584 [Quaeritorhiza haematococci]